MPRGTLVIDHLKIVNLESDADHTFVKLVNSKARLNLIIKARITLLLWLATAFDRFYILCHHFVKIKKIKSNFTVQRFSLAFEFTGLCFPKGVLKHDAVYYLEFITVVILFLKLQAGMQAVRENRYVILSKDFEKGYKSSVKKDETEHEFYK